MLFLDYIFLVRSLCCHFPELDSKPKRMPKIIMDFDPMKVTFGDTKSLAMVGDMLLAAFVSSMSSLSQR